jgi:hypothetical protein
MRVPLELSSIKIYPCHSFLLDRDSKRNLCQAKRNGRRNAKRHSSSASILDAIVLLVAKRMASITDAPKRMEPEASFSSGWRPRP